MKKFVQNVIKYVGLILIVVSLLFGGLFCIPNVHDGVFRAKYNRLNDTDARKIVFVGGSNLSYGLNSQMVKDKFDYDIINLGYFGSFGSWFNINASNQNLNEGDIVILILEYELYEQSNMLNGVSTWYYLEHSPMLWQYIEPEDRGMMLTCFKDFEFLKLKNTINGTWLIENEYDTEWNLYGDYIQKRPEELQAEEYKGSLKLSQPLLGKDVEILINEYYEELTAKGVKVYISFPPMYKEAMEDISNLSKLKQEIENRIHAPVISDPNNYLFDSEWMYNTIYHCNDTGATERTKRLIKDMEDNIGIAR